MVKLTTAVEAQFQQVVRGRRLGRLERLRSWPSYRAAAAWGLGLCALGEILSRIDRWWPSLQPASSHAPFSRFGTLIGSAMAVVTTIALCLVGAAFIRTLGWLAYGLSRGGRT